MAKNRNPVMTPQQVSHQPPNVVFRTCSNFGRGLDKFKNDARTMQALADFIKLKSNNPLDKFGSKDTLFVPNTPLSGYIHAGLNHDVSLVYKISGRNPTVIDLYAIGTHDDLGTGQPSNHRRMQSNRKSWDSQDLEPANRFI